MVDVDQSDGALYLQVHKNVELLKALKGRKSNTDKQQYCHVYSCEHMMTKDTFFILTKCIENVLIVITPYEPHREKTCHWNFRPGPKQTWLYSCRTWLQA